MTIAKLSQEKFNCWSPHPHPSTLGSGSSHTKGEVDSGIRIGGAGLADLELVGSPPENDLPFPNREVGDVWAAPGEERGWEFTSGSGTLLLMGIYPC